MAYKHIADLNDLINNQSEVNLIVHEDVFLSGQSNLETIVNDQLMVTSVAEVFEEPVFDNVHEAAGISEDMLLDEATGVTDDITLDEAAQITEKVLLDEAEGIPVDDSVEQREIGGKEYRS